MAYWELAATSSAWLWGHNRHMFNLCYAITSFASFQ